MFFFKELTKQLDIHPKYLGPRLRETLEELLVREMEGTCDKRYGYVVCVHGVETIGRGLVRKDGSGLVTFNLNFRCIVMYPFKGEVIDGIVSNISTHGFFVDAGPLKIFVSHFLIPHNYEHIDSENVWVAEDVGLRIQPGTEVRVKVVGVHVDDVDKSIKVVGTIKEDYLGPHAEA